MSDLQAEAFKAFAEDAFPGESGEVVVDAGETAYLVTLQNGEAVEAAPA